MWLVVLALMGSGIAAWSHVDKKSSESLVVGKLQVPNPKDFVLDK
jgi:hypothetical protein